MGRFKLNRRQRRAADPEVQQRRLKHRAAELSARAAERAMRGEHDAAKSLRLEAERTLRSAAQCGRAS